MLESSNNENIKFREILEKPVEHRSEAEIDEVVNIIHKINFFQERKNLKESDLRELVNAIKFETMVEF